MTVEERIAAVLDRLVPIYLKATSEHPKDCPSNLFIKHAVRNEIRVKLINDNSLIPEYENKPCLY